MTRFFPLAIREIRRETPDCVSLALEAPAEAAPLFAFKQGQYLTLRAVIDGEEARRCYSICAAPTEGELRVAVKKVDGGRFSTFANERLKAGDIIEAMPPDGRFFTEMDAKAANLYVAFAAGSGITPILSILKTVLAEEPHSRFILFYGNRSFDSIIFREALEALKNRWPDRLAVHHVLSREALAAPLFRGRIDGEKARAFARHFFDAKEVRAFFLCGPEPMVFSVKEALEAAGAPAGSVHFELFDAPKARTAAPSGEPALRASVSVIQDGARFEFELDSSGSTILDAAMRAGADLPFSCKGGVCCTCKAKLLEGAVEMERNYALEPDEVAAGYILTCQSRPKTPRVTVSFDA